MTVYYFEGSPIVAPFTITTNEPYFASDTISLSQQRASQGAQRWELKFGIQTRGGEADLLVGLATGVATPKTMIMPQLLEVDRLSTVTVQGVTSGASTAGASSVTMTFSGQVGRILRKGTFIQFTNHSKVYMVTADVTTVNGMSVPIYPTLRVNVPSSSGVLHNLSPTRTTLTYYRSVDTLTGVTYEDGVLVNPGTINLIEAI